MTSKVRIPSEKVQREGRGDRKKGGKHRPSSAEFPSIKRKGRGGGTVNGNSTKRHPN